MACRAAGPLHYTRVGFDATVSPAATWTTPTRSTSAPTSSPCATSRSTCPARWTDCSPFTIYPYRIALTDCDGLRIDTLKHVSFEGRQYLREVSLFGGPFRWQGAGEIVSWSRVLRDEEALCVINAHGTEVRGGNA